MNQIPDQSWRPLYHLAFVLSAVMLGLIPLQVVVFILTPPPQSVQGFFELYRQSPIRGLLSLDLLYLFSNAIIIVLYLALYVLLRQERPVTTLLAVIFAMIGIACYYPSNPAFEMLTLSRLYGTSVAWDRLIYLAAGEAVMAGYTGTAFDVYYVFNAIGLLLFAHAILTSPRWPGAIGIWGLVSGVLMIVPSSAGMVGMVFSLLSLIPWLIFVTLLMTRFRRLSQPADQP